MNRARLINLWRRYRPRLSLFLDLGFLKVKTRIMYACDDSLTYQYAVLAIEAFGWRLVEFKLWTDERM